MKASLLLAFTLSAGWLTALILIVIVLLLLLYAITVQRSLVRLEEMCKNALGQIDVQLNSRWDALTQLANTATAYAQHESETLLQTIQQRRTTGGNTDVHALEAQNEAANSVLQRIFALAEQYPTLQANSVYRDLMASINKYENNVRIERMVYNDAATRFNSKLRMFPSNLVALLLKFTAKPYFQVEEGKTDMPHLDLRKPAQ